MSTVIIKVYSRDTGPETRDQKTVESLIGVEG